MPLEIFCPYVPDLAYSLPALGRSSGCGGLIGQRQRPTRPRLDACLYCQLTSFYGDLMARMTPDEANAVNILLGYLAGRDEDLPVPVVHALETLASRAHNRIQTGWDENAVRDHWPTAYVAES
jgi:hypothetical protein